MLLLLKGCRVPIFPFQGCVLRTLGGSQSRVLGGLGLGVGAVIGVVEVGHNIMMVLGRKRYSGRQGVGHTWGLQICCLLMVHAPAL